MAKKTNPIQDNVEVKVATEAVESPKTVADDVVDINFDEVRKKKFRVEGDDDRILELDTSDFSTINRIEDSYPKLVALEQKASLIRVSEDDDINIPQTLREIDTEMRQIIDFIFDSDVSAKCAPSGSMFDPFNGKFRYEHILDKITSLYENNLNKEYALFKKRIQKHTDKYVKR